MMTFEELQENVIKWGDERGITHSSNSHKQALKMVEEIGEICRGVIKEDRDEIVDGIGDGIVTMIILANQYGYDIEYCLETAWHIIKNRTGRTIDGVFIKKEDLEDVGDS